MNEFIERFLALPPRQRVFAVVAAVGAILFAYYYFLFSPRNAEIARKEAKLAALKKEKDAKTALAANLPAARKQVADLEADLKAALVKLPDQREIPQLLSSISAIARESGLEVNQFKPQAEKPRDFYAEVPVAMRVKGSFYQVSAFFSRVSEMQRIVNISGITLGTPVLAPPDPVRLNISCRATTYRFLDDAERARLKKKQQKGKKR